MKRIYFTVTNDLTYDQRMHRICTSLAQGGDEVVLVGRKLKHSLPIQQRLFSQRRIRCLFNRGFLFYIEYNTRLFFFLLTKKMDAICAIDLDTILPCLFISKLKGISRIYDAHEYFTELKEVRTRAFVKKVWTAIEQFAVPKFKHGYTVSEGLSKEFSRAYARSYVVIRNLPLLQQSPAPKTRENFLVYQGAVNEGRGFEVLIPAMKAIHYKLVVCGGGNYMTELKELIRVNGVETKVELKGMMLPDDLKIIAANAALGIGLSEKEGINQYHALPNKFLEYMHAGLPQIAMNFPEYQKINNDFRVAVLLDELSVDTVAVVINSIMTNKELREEMSKEAQKAREVFCWQNEEKILLQFYQHVFGE